ncbi:hypothetical protein [Methylocystis sp.]|uniref:hypothetical protein n=1 Tax=Methylocystis sp. TaxID=1911079 RepID=UPI0025EFFDE1|nr:hypothetical protein [Methylocystis sp.]
MTLAEKDDTIRVVNLVLSQCAACATADQTCDLAMRFVHGGAAALVTAAGYDFAIDFMKKLTAILENEVKEDRHVAMN